MKRWKKIAIGFVTFVGLLAVAAWVIYGGGKHEAPGTVTATQQPKAAVSDKAARQSKVSAPQTAAKQILFGDLHVHTTFSADAFMRSLPLLNGEGAHPPADACDFARFCSSLDFFALTDHAESLTPRHWQESKESIRQCNAVSGDPANPDLVAYVGWEWSHVGRTPEEHYGHKNVIFRDTADDKLPARPIAAGGVAEEALKAPPPLPWYTLLSIPIREFSRRQRYLDLAVYQKEVKAIGKCKPGVDSRELPKNCREFANTPAELFEKLGQWGYPTMVIPHGTTWGFYTPPGSSWDKQLAGKQFDPTLQGLVEVYSGHGNSEEYRTWRAIDHDATGKAVCPAPTDNYEPCCHRAGELIRKRCGDVPKAECDARVAKVRANFLELGVGGHLTVPGATAEDWGACGQCRDCVLPAFNYRPRNSVQYMLARGNFDDPKKPNHARFGMLASSDNHTARPGTGYKEFARTKMTEATGARSSAWRDRIFGKPRARSPQPRVLTQEQVIAMPAFNIVQLERQASFFMTGGLIAVHSPGRSRDAIWGAMQKKEVYGTSGDRILLWFDMINAPSGRAPMGSEVTFSGTPRFRVRAAGAFVQKPGCPDWASKALGAKRLQNVCVGECYNPGDTRKRITRIEVIRIRPQVSDDEKIAPLIDDTWKTIPCPMDQPTCTVEFEDPAFGTGGRDVLYYVRAIEESSPAVNAGGIRCQGAACDKVKPCYGNWRTSSNDDCLSPNEERAWSSPIFLDFAKAATPTPASAPDAGAGR